MQAASDFEEPPALERQFAVRKEVPCAATLHEEPVVEAPPTEQPRITEQETDQLCDALDGCVYVVDDPVATKSIKHKLSLSTVDGMFCAPEETVEPVMKPLLDKMSEMLEKNKELKPYIKKKVPQITWSVDCTKKGKELVFNIGSGREKDSMFVAARIKMIPHCKGFKLKASKWYKSMAHNKKREAIPMCSPAGLQVEADKTRRMVQGIGRGLMEDMMGECAPPMLMRTDTMAIQSWEPSTV